MTAVTATAGICGGVADCGFLVVVTDHDHYVCKDGYSPGTGDFDFRNDTTYQAGTPLSYRTEKPYGTPITLGNSYQFRWTTLRNDWHVLRLAVNPIRKNFKQSKGVSSVQPE